jgi:hypothetical protein
VSILFRPVRHRLQPHRLKLHRPRQRRLITALAGLASLALVGCRPGTDGLQVPTVLYIAIAANNDQTVNAELREDYQEKLGLMQVGFRQLYPGSTFQLGVYPGQTMARAMQNRIAAGLEPDLLFVSGDMALQLLRSGLVDPFPTDPALLNQFDPTLIRRLRDHKGRLAGLPVLIQTQLACFNRRQLAEAPRTLTELLEVSASGQEVGLPLTPFNLLWSAGSIGAIPALERLARRQPVSAADAQKLEEWLAWLQNASHQQRVTFFGNQELTDTEFMAGRLAWIPCRSTMLPLMRRHLGTHLGVAPLPDGPDDRASPVNRLRVIALGRNSSASGRQRALAFSLYGVNPLTQRGLTLGSQTVLPANRFVTVPVQSSQILRTLEDASVQGKRADALVALLHGSEHRLPRLQGLLTRLVFGDIAVSTARQQLMQILNDTP